MNQVKDQNNNGDIMSLESSVLTVPLRRTMARRYILITGGLGVIGRRVYELYSNVLPDAHFIVADLEGERAEAFRDKNPAAQFLSVDFLDAASIDHFINQVSTGEPLTDLIAVHGGVGNTEWETKQRSDSLTAEQMVYLNLTSVVLLLGGLLDRRLLVGTADNHGTATCISSCNRFGGFRSEPYSAAKSGLLGAVREFAATRGAKSAVRVNMVTPGTVIDTWARGPREKMQQIASGMPIGRYAHANDIATTILMLTEQMIAVTGQEIVVDGGQLLVRVTPRKVAEVAAMMKE